MNKNSLDAYKAIGAHLDGHYLAIYEALLAHGPQTAWQIANSNMWDVIHFDVDHEELTSAQVFRRLSELERAGWIERMDWTAPSPSGCQCSVWWVKT